MGKVKLASPQPNYLERPVTDPEQAMNRAREVVRESRRGRARFLISTSAVSAR